MESAGRPALWESLNPHSPVPHSVGAGAVCMEKLEFINLAGNMKITP